MRLPQRAARPLTAGALAELEQMVRDDLNAGDEKARGTGTRLVMIGILPTLRKRHMHLGTLTASQRFRVLNEQIFAARGEAPPRSASSTST